MAFGTNFSQRVLCSEIYFGDPSPEVNTARFEELRSHQSEFESIVGAEVDWQELEGRKACRVAVYRPNSSIAQRDEWSSYIDWFLETQERIRRGWHAVAG